MVNTHKLTLLYIALLCIVLAIQYGCTGNATAQAPVINNIKITYWLPDINTDGRIFMREDSVHIYRRDSVMVYRATAVTTVDLDDFTKNPRVHYFCYLIFNRDDTIGYYYDSLYAQQPAKKITPDSFMRRYAPRPPRPLSGLETLHQRRETDSGIIIEKYYYKVKPNNTFPDTAIYYYTAPGKFYYSFNDSLDKAKHMQLYKYTFYYKEEKPFLPERTFLWALSPGISNNENQLQSLIERHKIGWR